MKKTPKVSVIVPVYGVEKYIGRCVRSLFGQTLEDIEYIFVDDCTPDGSISVLNSVLSSYPARQEQVKIIRHEKNEGLVHARQTGLKAASGEYIAHCDSDDWVDTNLYGTLYDQAAAQGSDMVAFVCKYTDGERTIKEALTGNRTETAECLADMIHGKMWWSLCNKLIRRDVYRHRDIIYPTDGMGEDMCLSLQLLYHCKSISYNHDVCYHYYQNPTSMTKVQTEESCLSRFRQICRNVEIVKKFYSGKPVNDSLRKGFRYLEFNAKRPLTPLLSERKYRKLWRQTYQGCEWSVLTDPEAPAHDRLKSLLCLFGINALQYERLRGWVKRNQE